MRNVLGLFLMLFLIVVADVSHSIENPYPQRIISLGPDITEELYLLGAQDRLKGTTIYCQRPQEAKTKERIANSLEVNLEKVVSLNPDLVIATSLTNPRDVKKLKSLGIKVITFSQAKTFIELCDHFLELSRVIGEEEKAKKIIALAQKKVSFINEKIKNLYQQKVFVQIGAKPLFTVTQDSFINDLILLAGGINSVGNIKNGIYSRENVLKINPDVIIITTMGITGRQEKAAWKKHEILKAVQNDRIYIVDSYNFCSPTPLTFVDALKEMVSILHPSQIKRNKTE